MALTSAQALVDTLIVNGITRAFCVPGESYLAVLDALYDARQTIELITCRQEGGAAYMAEAHGKLTGTPGICLVTRGPGATNASVGVHLAMQDSTPMILFVGQIARGHKDREAFQEFDTFEVFRGLAKWATDINQPERTAEIVTRALHIAQSGRPGPVVIGLPEDMLQQTIAPAKVRRLVKPQPSKPPDSVMKRFHELLAGARQPLVIGGGGGWNEATSDNLKRFAETFDLPVGAAFRRQDIFDNRHPNYVGHIGLGIDPALGAMVQAADLLIVLGARLGEATTSGYTLIDTLHGIETSAGKKLVHVHPQADELNKVYRADLPIVCGLDTFLEAAGQTPLTPIVWTSWTQKGRAAYEAFIAPRAMPGEVQLGEVVSWLNAHLSDQAIITNGAGNYCIWINRHYQYRQFRTQLGPTNGTMGYGLPAAIAAGLEHKGTPVVAFAGDGCFMMTCQEMATAMQYGVDLILVVVSNSVYGTIRMHQQLAYPDRPHGTALDNPDFVALARAFGAHGVRIETTADFPPAFTAAEARGGVTLLEIRIPDNASTPDKTLADL